MEKTVQRLQPMVTDHGEKLKQLCQEVAVLHDRVEDRSLCINVRVVDLPERCEGQSMEHYMENRLLQEVMGARHPTSSQLKGCTGYLGDSQDRERLLDQW
ncbi:hypothetical protein NDU88_002759 [Pleurodeles waltl]|uniref:Uncharacterized protein n=1 Tax=Pleurodeles waltl TaxID=8319 RepID=A0AAV7NMV1_PLEWA|nr:hypothetical protein NDU88_002759 [Pleurodeles waltl]